MVSVGKETEMKPEFDAIVVGSGLTGSLAARELTRAGLRVLLLERGERRPCPSRPASSFPNIDLEDFHIQRNCYLFEGSNLAHYFVNDREHPYLSDPDAPFWWIRGYQLGGRSATWAAQSYRWSDLDFSANLEDGAGCDWPIRYADLAPWYSKVERLVGLTGRKEGLPQIPDGEFGEARSLNAVEEHLRETLQRRFSRILTPSRIAEGRTNGNRACQFCGETHSDGVVYYSSINGALPDAMATGKLEVKTASIVHSVLLDSASGMASGVRVIDSITKAETDYRARIVFMCASTIATNQILLNSVSRQFPEGIGNSSGVLGRYLIDHHWKAGATARIRLPVGPYHSEPEVPWGAYVPRFRNLGTDRTRDYSRGFGYQISSGPLDEEGAWGVNFHGFGETLPSPSNFMELDRSVTDPYGLPLVKIRFEYSGNEYAMRNDMQVSAVEMLEAAGAEEVYPIQEPAVPGHSIHEMGGARMGRDKKDSFLNAWNQSHEVPNLFVTDGACMASSACQNPSITYMALTARACHHAVELLKKGELRSGKRG
jgi:choline dehydrogenase-like flavoprotein